MFWWLWFLLIPVWYVLVVFANGGWVNALP